MKEYWKKTLKLAKALVCNRFFYLCLAVTVGMSAVSVRLYQLQIVQGSQWLENASQSSLTTATLYMDSPRGDIYDCNGVLLATTRTAYKVQMVYVEREQAFRDAMYLELIQLFQKNGDSYQNTLSRYLTYPLAWGSSAQEEEQQKRWLNTIVLRKSDRDRIHTPEDAFAYLREEVLQIDPSYTEEEAYQIMIIRYQTEQYGLSSLTPTVLATDVCEKTMEIIQSRHLDFPGVSTEEVYYREYVNSQAMSHVLGYVRAISPEEYQERKDEGYTSDDVLGKLGIEKAAEAYLRGQRGTKTVYLDQESGAVRVLSTQDSIPGNDVYLTLDADLQTVAMEALADAIETIRAGKNDVQNFGDANAGAVVVEDVKTGEILAMVSYPTYDNSIFVAPSTDKEAQQAITDLFQDPNSASLNRTTQGLYPIGSTFKPVVALAGLEGGTLTPYQRIACTGSIVLGNQQHHCLGTHGELNLEAALRHSCNIYFQRAGIAAGIDAVDAWAQLFGLGEKTGVEISEYSGYRSNQTTMQLKESDITHIWSDSDTAQSAIGQLYTLFTPLQMSNYTAALANGGYRNTPYLIQSAISKDGTVLFATDPSSTKIPVSADSLAAIRKGMVSMADNNGTAQKVFAAFPKGFVAAKTGTPETGLEAFGQSSHSVLICYAPADDPQIAVSVVIEHGVWGSNSLQVAGKILDSYFAKAAVDPRHQARAEGLLGLLKPDAFETGPVEPGTTEPGEEDADLNPT